MKKLLDYFRTLWYNIYVVRKLRKLKNLVEKTS